VPFIDIKSFVQRIYIYYLNWIGITWVLFF